MECCFHAEMTAPHTPQGQHRFECRFNIQQELEKLVSKDGLTSYAHTPTHTCVRGMDAGSFARQDAQPDASGNVLAVGRYVGKRSAHTHTHTPTCDGIRSMSVCNCMYCADIIEPLLVPQWYVDCKDMARRACEVRTV